jgi:hypothetical protein
MLCLGWHGGASKMGRKQDSRRIEAAPQPWVEPRRGHGHRRRVPAETLQAGRLRSRVKLVSREHLVVAQQPIQQIAPTYIRQDRPVVESRRPLHL